MIAINIKKCFINKMFYFLSDLCSLITEQISIIVKTKTVYNLKNKYICVGGPI